MSQERPSILLWLLLGFFPGLRRRRWQIAVLIVLLAGAAWGVARLMRLGT
jgi:hypothetical protein